MKRALLVGAGGMGRAWAKNLAAHPSTRVAGWVDIAPGMAESAANESGLDCWSGTSLADGFAATQPDFVVDVTVPEAHAEVTVQALEAGIPVLGEKPMAASMTEARRMVAASERSGKLYMVSQSRRYISAQNAFRNLVREHLGPLGILNADFYIGAHFGGFRDVMPSPLVLDMAIHTFDQARFLTGADPVAVYAEEWNPGWSWYRGDACATAVFEMVGGLRFTYRGSWCAEGLPTSWDGAWRAVGAYGTATWDGHSGIAAETVEKTGGFHSEMRPLEARIVPSPGGIEGSLIEFLNALETGHSPNGECRDNIKSLAMVFGAMRSARERRRVEIAEVLIE